MTLGYAGLLYEMLYNGHIIALEVAPKTISSNSTSTAPTTGTAG